MVEWVPYCWQISKFSMYRCFQLELGSVPACNQTTPFGYELVLRQRLKDLVQQTLTEKIIGGDVIDATLLQNNWFPEVNADIFISHSHSDKDGARYLALWLRQTFDLVAFIDSDIWGYADNLLEQIDDHYCYKKDRNDSCEPLSTKNISAAKTMFSDSRFNTAFEEKPRMYL